MADYPAFLNYSCEKPLELLGNCSFIPIGSKRDAHSFVRPKLGEKHLCSFGGNTSVSFEGSTTRTEHNRPPAAIGALVEVPTCRTVLIVDDEFENLVVLEAL